MTLTPTDIALLLGAATALIGALAAAAVSIIGALKAMKAEVAEVKTQAAVIVGHVNSEKTAGQGREDVLKKENELLREVLEENKRASALLAQSVASKQPEHTTPSALAETVANGIGKTDAAITELKTK